MLPAIRLHCSQALRFITCGLLGAGMEFLILRVLVGHYGISPFAAYIPSALIPCIFVFYFNRYVTFRGGTGNTVRQTRRFLLVYSCAFTLNYCLSSLLYAWGVRLCNGAEIGPVVLTIPRIAYGAKALAIGVTAVLNYWLSHSFIFRKEKEMMRGT